MPLGGIRGFKMPKRIKSYKIAGKTKDGVFILKAPSATNFTKKELRAAISAARKKSSKSAP